MISKAEISHMVSIGESPQFGQMFLPRQNILGAVWIRNYKRDTSIQLLPGLIKTTLNDSLLVNFPKKIWFLGIITIAGTLVQTNLVFVSVYSQLFIYVV